MSKIDISHPRGGTEWIGDLELKIRSALKNDHNGLVSRYMVMDECAQEEQIGETITLEKHYL